LAYYRPTFWPRIDDCGVAAPADHGAVRE
jgi:hypothetical protein